MSRTFEIDAPARTTQYAGLAHRNERDAHDLPVAASRLTPIMQARLRKALAWAAQSETDQQGRSSCWLVGALALSLAVETGHDPDEVADVRISPLLGEADWASLADWPMPSIMSFDDHEPGLWVRATEPEQRPGVWNHAGVQSPGVWFNLHTVTHTLLRKTRFEAMRAEAFGSEEWPRLFDESLDIDAAVSQFIDVASRALGFETLPSLDDCALFLRRELAQSFPVDAAVSFTLTGVSAPRNSTRAHYTAISLEDAALYQETAVKQFFRDPHAGPARASPTALSGLVVGSRRCPRKSSVERLRDMLLERAKLGRGRLPADRIAEFDRAFTAYSWLFFSLHTGWRPWKSLLSAQEDIDWTNGTFFIEDKRQPGAFEQGTSQNRDEGGPDNDPEDRTVSEEGSGSSNPSQANSKRRWLPLGPRVLEQLQAYYAHVAARAKYDDLNPIKTPADLARYLRQIPGLDWDMPLNFGRHYLRSALVGKVSGDVTDAYLGHWDEGAEPWWNGSGLDPVAYSNEVHRVIPSIFPQDEWPVVKGLR